MAGSELPDINVLIYAYRGEAELHPESREWMLSALQRRSLVLTDFVITGFVRLATNRRLFAPPATLPEAFAFVRSLLTHPGATLLLSPRGHWSTFERLCRELDISGGDMSDAYLAAIAVDHDCQLVSADRGFRRFTDLRIRLIEMSAE